MTAQNNSQHDEQRLRAYLLGRCTPEEAEKIELDLLSDDELPDMLAVLEDELTEEYVAGELSVQDSAFFEMHFLSSAKRRHKIEASALLLGGEKAGAKLPRWTFVPMPPDSGGSFGDYYGSTFADKHDSPLDQIVEGGRRRDPPPSEPWPPLQLPQPVAAPRWRSWSVLAGVAVAVLVAVLYPFLRDHNAPVTSLPAAGNLHTPKPSNIEPAISEVKVIATSLKTLPPDEDIPMSAGNATTQTTLPPGQHTVVASKGKAAGPTQQSIVLELDVWGSNFPPTAVVKWNGIDLNTVWQGPTLLKAYKWHDPQMPGTADVIVLNRADGQASSPMKVTLRTVGIPTKDRTGHPRMH